MWQNVSNAGPATIGFQSDATVFSEDDGTIECCVQISTISLLGCDIVVLLQTMEVWGTNAAGMGRALQPL